MSAKYLNELSTSESLRDARASSISVFDDIPGLDFQMRSLASRRVIEPAPRSPTTDTESHASSGSQFLDMGMSQLIDSAIIIHLLAHVGSRQWALDSLLKDYFIHREERVGLRTTELLSGLKDVDTTLKHITETLSNFTALIVIPQSDAKIEAYFNAQEESIRSVIQRLTTVCHTLFIC
jgi:hypothetical protein